MRVMPGSGGLARSLAVAAGVLAVCLVVTVAVVGTGRWWGKGERLASLPSGSVSPANGSVSPSTSPSFSARLGSAASASPSGSPSASRGGKASGAQSTRSGGRPGSGNTGVPAGTALKVVTGDRTYATDNQVVSGLDIRGFVKITGRNVTIKNSIVRGGANPRCNSAVIQIAPGGSGTIKDSEIAPAHPSPCLDGIWALDVTLLRLNIHGAVDGLKAYDNVTLRDSYVHDLSWFASDPNQGGGPTHNDAVQTYEGNRNVTLSHNNLDPGAKGNAAYQVTQDGGQVATNLRIENNWLDGGGCTLNFSDKGGPTPMTGIYVVGNRFGRDSEYDCPILLSTGTVLSGNSGNVFDDNGRPIPAPQQHD